MSKFSKPATTIAQQIALLESRGLNIRNPKRAEKYLEVISYFRLTSYMHPFQMPQSKKHLFKQCTEFKDIVELYAFDREVRLLINDAIERVEVAVRATLNNHMSIKYQVEEQPNSGSHWYLNQSLFKDSYDYDRMIIEIESCQKKAKKELKRDIDKINRSNASEEDKKLRIQNRIRENYPRFYSQNYDEPVLIPSWSMVEELTFGSISHLYQGLAKDADRKAISRRFDVPQDVFQSWLHTLTFVRNCCAHHSRLWNRELSVPPKIPKNNLWNLPTRLQPSKVQPSKRVYIILLMLAHLMREVSPDSQLMCDKISQHKRSFKINSLAKILSV